MIRFRLHLPTGEATTGKLPFKLRIEAVHVILLNIVVSLKE